METTPLESRPLLARALCAIALALIVFVILAAAQTTSVQPLPSETHRKPVQKIEPTYPEMAKALKLVGTVRLSLKVAPNGKVVSAEVIGGHPVLARAAIDAVLHWRYQAGAQQTSEIAIVNFER